MLKYRLISGTCLISALLTALFASGPLGATFFLFLGGAMISIALKEFIFMLGKCGYQAPKNLTIASGLAYFASISLPAFVCGKSLPGLEIMTMAVIISVGFFNVFRSENHKKALIEHFFSLAAILYIAWPLGFIAKIYFIDGMGMSGRYLVLFFVLATKSSDIGAYFTGTTTGKLLKGGNHKIAPRLSPGKSWEGFVGGIVLSSIVGSLLVLFFGENMTVQGQEVLTVWGAILLGIPFGTLGFFGDIAESVLKRSSGEKDSGSILPGMGGVLDVVDSLILVAPLFFGYLMLCM